MGVPPNHPFIDGFSLVNHPFGVSPFMETPNMGIHYYDNYYYILLLLSPLPLPYDCHYYYYYYYYYY